MGLIPSYCRALILLHKRFGLKGPLLTLGNQDLWASYDQLKHFFNEMECPSIEVSPSRHTSRLFRQQPGTKNFVHARTFFEMMGIKDYYDIDKFDLDEPRILHDLNMPIPPEFCEKFNLIIDGGTIEHIFDVRQVMENIVRACRKSGWVVHITPASSYVDHGFYSFSPCFFYDFYGANRFGEFVCYILQARTEDFLEACSYFEYDYRMDLTSLIDPQRTQAVFFAAKKLRSVKSLMIPNQGDYQAEVRTSSEIPDHRDSLTSPKLNDPLAGGLVPGFLIPYLNPVLPFLRKIRNTVNPPYKRLRKM